MGLFSPSKSKVLSEITNAIHSTTIAIVGEIGESRAKELFDGSSCMVFNFYVGVGRHKWEKLYKKPMVDSAVYDGLYELIEQILNRGRMSQCYKFNSGYDSIMDKYETMGWNYQNSQSISDLRKFTINL